MHDGCCLGEQRCYVREVALLMTVGKQRRTNWLTNLHLREPQRTISNHAEALPMSELGQNKVTLHAVYICNSRENHN